MINPGHLHKLIKSFEMSASRFSEKEILTKEKMVEFVAKNVSKKSSNLKFGDQQSTGYREVTQDPKDVTINSIDKGVAEKIIQHMKKTKDNTVVNVKNKKGASVSDNDLKAPDFNINFPAFSFMLPAVTFPYASLAGLTGDFLDWLGDDYDNRKKETKR